MQNINTFFSTFQQIHVYVYIYMAMDLKVFVKSLNCEDRSCSVGNPRDFFSSSRKSFCARKLNIMNHYCIHIQIHILYI